MHCWRTQHANLGFGGRQRHGQRRAGGTTLASQALYNSIYILSTHLTYSLSRLNFIIHKKLVTNLLLLPCAKRQDALLLSTNTHSDVLRQDMNTWTSASGDDVQGRAGFSASASDIRRSAMSTLVKQTAAASLGVDAAWVESRLQLLDALLLTGDTGTRLFRVPTLCRLLQSDPRLLALRLVALRRVLPPSADAASLAVRRPELLLDPGGAEQVASATSQLVQVLPLAGHRGFPDIGHMLNREAGFLDVPRVIAALAELRRIMPNMDPEAELLNNPALLVMAQTPEPRTDFRDEYYV